jgi:hypothetical protein
MSTSRADLATPARFWLDNAGRRSAEGSTRGGSNIPPMKNINNLVPDLWALGVDGAVQHLTQGVAVALFREKRWSFYEIYHIDSEDQTSPVVTAHVWPGSQAAGTRVHAGLRSSRADPSVRLTM